MYINAHVMIKQARGGRCDDLVVLLGDNTTAVARINHAGRGHTGPAGDMMRMLGALELENGMSFVADHIACAENTAAETLSRKIQGVQLTLRWLLVYRVVHKFTYRRRPADRYATCCRGAAGGVLSSRDYETLPVLRRAVAQVAVTFESSNLVVWHRSE
jgi:hypothetical protein